jgi:hypothetical protein
VQRFTWRRAARALAREPWRRAAAPIYGALIAAELGAQAAIDRALLAPEVDVGDVTLLVKTFERPHLARRLIDSVIRVHPSLRIVLADDSATPMRDPRAKLVALPYDSGLSAGRNAALAEIDTPFFVLADDDFVFFRETRLDRVLEVLRAHEEIDIVGGRVIDLPFLRAEESASRSLGRIAGLERREVVRNFFVGRTARVREVGWDPELKLVEHADFFERARGVLTIVFDPSLAVLHAKAPFDAAYAAHREDVARYHALLALKRQRRR